jgi:hypothetical protein
LEKYRIDIGAIQEIRCRGSGVLDTGSIILMNIGNESNTFGISFLINRMYKQAVMNFETVDERICFLRMRGKFNNFTVILVHAPNREKNKLVKDSLYDKLNQIYQRIPEHDTKIIVGNFNTKIEREGVLKTVIGRWSLHETSNEGGTL